MGAGSGPRLVSILVLAAAAGCAPPRVPPDASGRPPVFVVWVEHPDRYGDIARRHVALAGRVLSQAAFEVRIITPGDAAAACRAHGLPHEMAPYAVGRAHGASVVGFVRIMPTGEEETESPLCVQLGVFDFRTAACRTMLIRESEWRLRLMLALGGETGLAQIIRQLEEVRKRHATPFDPAEVERELKKLPDRAVIGIQMQVADAGRLTGVRITSVHPESPACRAGLRPGDRVLRCAGRETRYPADLVEAMAGRRVGEPVTVVIQRGRAMHGYRIRTVPWRALLRGSSRALVGRPAPDFQFMVPGGGAPSRLSQLRGWPVLVEFWSTASPTSVRGLMTTRRLHDRWHARGLRIVSVRVDRPEKQGGPGLPPADFFAWGTAFDPDRRVSARYRVFGLPTRIFIDAEGIARHVNIGGSNLERVIRRHLAPKGNKANHGCAAPRGNR